LETLLCLLYRIVGYAVYAALFLLLPFSRLLGNRYGYEPGQRLGRYRAGLMPESMPGPTLWIHASSVGEVQAAVILVEALLAWGKAQRIVLSSTTEQGHRMAMDRLGSKVACVLAPLDLPPAVNRAIRFFHPDLYIGLETELWPVLLASLGRAGVPKLLLNGRLSERSFGRYLKIRSFIAPLVSGFQALAVITAADGRRFADLGAPEAGIRVCGNIKYDMPAEQEDDKQRRLRSRLALDGRQAFLCGSTHEGEEALLLPVFQTLAAELALVWIVAPRHLERLPAVISFFRGIGLSYDLYSELSRKPRTADVVLVDTMGDLADLYCIGDHIFCGGSLVNRGGHNVMEAARWGRPVCFGPHMKDFEDAARLLRDNGGGFQVEDAQALTTLLQYHHAHPDEYRLSCMRAAETAASQRGAVARQVAIVAQCLADKNGRPH
jgi:3-deoxy-D-manno-octulosonic-acid transferase